MLVYTYIHTFHIPNGNIRKKKKKEKTKSIRWIERFNVIICQQVCLLNCHAKCSVFYFHLGTYLQIFITYSRKTIWFLPCETEASLYVNIVYLLCQFCVCFVWRQNWTSSFAKRNECNRKRQRNPKPGLPREVKNITITTGIVELFGCCQPFHSNNISTLFHPSFSTQIY